MKTTRKAEETKRVRKISSEAATKRIKKVEMLYLSKLDVRDWSNNWSLKWGEIYLTLVNITSLVGGTLTESFDWSGAAGEDA